MSKLDYSRLADLEMYINKRDFPDFSDSYFTFGSFKEENGDYRDLTDEELDELNDDSGFVYDQVMKRVF